MLVIEKQLNIQLEYDFVQQYSLNSMVFFDIETTGFSPEYTTLYLIGCTFYKDNHWNIIQWFADDNSSEYHMLISFFDFIKDFQTIIHYNGSGFDMPYILKKCKQFNLTYDFTKLESIDIYKRILPYKKIFKTDNLKQKTMELFLGVTRDDQFTGGQLIDVYAAYIKHKQGNQENVEALYRILLLHNEDDLKGMLKVVNILCYCDLFEQDFTIASTLLEDENLLINFILKSSLPKRINLGNNLLYLLAYRDQATLKIKLYKNELKYFYDNYKDYYYLPLEDAALHKSVAFYVDKDFRTKAKAANCYSKKTGCFLPQYNEIVTPYFKIDYYDKITYFETTKEVIDNTILMKQYVKHILPKLFK